jgi:hypothetical protein
MSLLLSLKIKIKLNYIKFIDFQIILFTLSSLNHTDASFAGAFKTNGCPTADKNCPIYKYIKFEFMNILMNPPNKVSNADKKI